MKSLLIVAATPYEIAPLREQLSAHYTEEQPYVFQRPNARVTVLITGVGIAATAFALGRMLAQQSFDWVLNLGVAGAIDRTLALGQVVQVVTERWADLGVEEADGRFTDVFALGLTDGHEFPYQEGRITVKPAELPGLAWVQGITVQRVHGHAPSIAAFTAQFPDAQVESMEGAAVFYACALSHIRVVQLRAISNYVEPRNRDAWQLGPAIEALNEVAWAAIRAWEAHP